MTAGNLNASGRKYQLDRQDGRKRAKGDDSDFIMKITIQTDLPLPTQRPRLLALADRKNPVALEEATGPTRRPFQWL